MSRTSPSATADASTEAVPRRAKHDIHYTETSFLGAYRVIVRYLNAVGRVTTDPFRCPLATQFRT